MLSKSALIILLGLIIAYFAIYFGDGVNVFAADVFSAPKDEDMGVAGVPIVLSTILAVLIGATSLIYAMYDIIWCDKYANDKIETAARAAFTVVILGYVFGVLAGPFTNYGPYPWNWASKFDLLPLLALVPTVLVVHDMVTYIMAVRQNRKTAREGGIIQIRRPQQ